ncbi:unnamed protein product [Rotaria sordida]|uniref:F-box domain-containing protein n=1 Tax=Rotaria sordida TaxID=392033 RepID=A0A815M3X2_9BILA|nr:unnamed protein product [Rotaria sordida]CAF1414148.1 unnamed protein product [Rotaria sordida]
MNGIITNIEMFPNELFIELFAYISPYDLYNTFSNLNFRFNSIIDSLRNLHFILEEDWDNKEHTIPFFASHISNLIIKHDEPIDFSCYSNIRSLKLSMPTENQCNAIQPYLLPNLEHLYISNLFFSNNSKQLCRFIFSPLFSRLRTCHIDRMTFNDYHSYSSLSLQQLTVSPCTWKSNMYRQIFKACPNLTYLRIIRLRNISFKLSFNFICSHTSLRHLHIHFYSIGHEWYSHIDWLLANIPNLENLTLLIDQNETNMEFPFDLFAHLLTHRAPHLINFKSIIFDLEQKWVEWSETQLTNTYDTLMNFIRSFENQKDYIVQLAYPISLPLPCHSQDGLQRYGNKTDSGKILCGIKNLNLLDKCVIYSLGSNNIFDFEQEMSNQTLCEIHTYDCTSSRPLQSINRVWFHPICIGKDAKLQESINPFTENSDHLMNKNELVFKSFRDIVQKNKHTHIHILKMDVEGSEYSVFADLFSQTNQIILPYQISFESHWWNKNIYHAMMHQKIFAQLWKSGYRFLQHEINIYDSSCIEWTLLRVFC